MSKPTLYFLPPSPPARAVLLFLRHLGIDVEVKLVDLHNGEQFTDEFLSLNPAHEVPVLVDGDFVLTESRAILQYLANNQIEGRKFYPTEPKARARVDQMLSFDHDLFTKSTIVYRPILHAGQKRVKKESVDSLVERLHVIEKLLESSKWIAGESPTIADFSVLATISTLVEFGCDLNSLPNLKRWYTQCHSFNGFEENKSGAVDLANLVKTKLEGTIF